MTPAVEVADLSSVVMSLALVLTVIFGAAYVLRRTPFGAGARGNGALKIVAALPLGAKERLLLVQARDQELLIAVSPAGVFNVGAAHGRAPADVTAAKSETQKFVLGDPT
jgi:flagellar protein FliO/FliZ